MGVPNRVTLSATGCSVSVPTTITLDETTGFDLKDCKFCLTIIPTGAGTGTLGLTWADSKFATTFRAAVDGAGRACTVDLSVAASTVLISDVDLYKLMLTPTAVVGVTAYSYSLAPIGT